MKRSHTEIWHSCLLMIKDNIPPKVFETWFLPIVPTGLKNDVLTIQVPSQFFYEYIEENFIDLLKKTIRMQIGRNASLEYSVIVAKNKSMHYAVKYPATDRKSTQNKSVSMPLDLNKDKARDIPNPFIIPGLKKIRVESQLVPTWSFDNFIEGKCNLLARSAGWAISQNPGTTSFNPLFIYSSAGLGKTHLSHAIGLQVKSNHPDKTVLYVKTDQFINQYAEAAKNNNRNDFIHFYQMIDVLIIDDIQFLSNAPKTQDIFFHIFNHLHQNNKQLIMTSDKPPVDLKGMETRLLSRFKWGLAADLQVPDFDTRKAILINKLYKDGVNMPDEVIEYLAHNVATNVREMEGALISILAQATLNKKEITIDLAREIIDKFVESTIKIISIDYIQKVVSDYFDVPIKVLISKTRKRDIVQARQITMYFSKILTKNSLSTIGQKCGNRDHTTVLHAYKTVNNLIDTNSQFKIYIDDIDKKLKLQ